MSSIKPSLQTTHYSLLTNQLGQSLIETIIAIFILTMGLTSALGLAIYALSRSGISQNEIIATNLAREGIDAVRAMRDSNWLAGDAKGGAWALKDCDDIGFKPCFPRSYQKANPEGGYDLNSGNQRVKIDLAGPGIANMSLDSTANYDLYLQGNQSYSEVPNGASIYARMINISFNTNPPYTNDPCCSNQEMIVKSVVAWRGKNCPNFQTDQDLLTLNSTCKIVTEEHMTNWKDYR